ncbi:MULTISPECIES: hypothetical protein [unclassified Cytobacillus]|nr:hypothetical protein [Cytobacillus sp. AMY 15.2]KAF0819935.1 hypothetical protein KIS4809_1207 [Bacillus sp. ZZV12-4809]MCM3093211.1 hypothetical protein [Cytobacillus sp. AMY 15.2]
MIEYRIKHMKGYDEKIGDLVLKHIAFVEYVHQIITFENRDLTTKNI